MSLHFINKSGAQLWFTRLPHRYLAAGAPKLQSFSTSIGYWKELTTKSMLERIVAALQLGEKKRASMLLLELSNGMHTLRSYHFQYILQYCAKSPDPSFALDTWKLMEEKDISNRGDCYLLTVRALCKAGYLKEAFDMIKLLGEIPGAYPLLSAFNCLLNSSIRKRSNYAYECLDLMEHRRVGKNSVTYDALLELAVLQRNLSTVHEIWKECSKYYSFSIISLRKFIWSFATLNDLKAAYAALQHMVDLALKENITVYRSAEGTWHDAKLDIPMLAKSVSRLSSCNRINEVPVISELECNKGLERKSFIVDETTIRRKSLGSHVMEILRFCFNDVIHACVRTKDYTLAGQLMSQMQTLGIKPSSLTFSLLVKAAIYEKGFYYGIEMVNIMEKHNMKPADSTLAALSISCSKSLELDLAEHFLNQISTCRNSNPYNSFLEACNTLDRPERAVRMLAKMKELHISPRTISYMLMFSLFGNVNVPYEPGNMISRIDAAKRIKAIEMEMMKNGIQHTFLSMKNLLKALGSEGMIQEMLLNLQNAHNLFYNRRVMTQLYNTVLHLLVKAKKSGLAIAVFKQMQKHGIRGDKYTYTILIDRCSLTKGYRSACALVSRMIRDGINISAVTYTSLIKTLLAFEDLDEALKLLHQALSEGIQCDIYLFNTILHYACDKGKLDVVELILELMHQEKVQPDLSTCSSAFATYADLGLHSTAMEALQVLSLRMISRDEHILKEKRAEFEHLVLAEEEASESEIMNYFKDDQDHIGSALLNLRWCAILGCSISWQPERSSWAKRLSTSYCILE